MRRKARSAARSSACRGRRGSIGGRVSSREVLGISAPTAGQAFNASRVAGIYFALLAVVRGMVNTALCVSISVAS